MVLYMLKSGLELRSWPRNHLSLKQKGDKNVDERTETVKEMKVGDTAFLIRIIFRQNTTWMGEIHWLNAEKKLYFRSLMELIMLMQEALARSGVPKADYAFRTWQANEETSLKQGRN